MKLSALKGKEQKTKVVVPGSDGEPDEEVEIRFRPGVLTIDVFEQVSDLRRAGEGEDVGMVAELLSNVLVAWDLEEDLEDGESRPLGTTVEDIRKVPLPFLGQVMEAMVADVTPTPPKDATSGEPSPQEAPQEASLSGTT